MLCPLSFADDTANSRVCAAAAEVAGQFMMSLLRRWIGILIEQRLGGNHESRSAETALLGVVVDKRLLDGMKLPARRGDALDRLDLPPLRVHGKNRAGVDGMTIHEHRASTTLSAITNALGSGEVESVAERVEQRDT